ncbi:hypothetical protein F5X68DRAFT_244330 [Plectosphaerella plurivora]|uniref:Uncharacterized protein n=1 Tax=Plectosphaerella plurivora TaxID=936078 RepID=A0A9P9AGG8_9PEZI|nr:hypothetical protein F5X68DRAFT_244330 [Plectosphaerella plurivora]
MGTTTSSIVARARLHATAAIRAIALRCVAATPSLVTERLESAMENPEYNKAFFRKYPGLNWSGTIDDLADWLEPAFRGRDNSDMNTTKAVSNTKHSRPAEHGRRDKSRASSITSVKTTKTSTSPDRGPEFFPQFPGFNRRGTIDELCDWFEKPKPGRTDNRRVSPSASVNTNITPSFITIIDEHEDDTDIQAQIEQEATNDQTEETEQEDQEGMDENQD